MFAVEWECTLNERALASMALLTSVFQYREFEFIVTNPNINNRFILPNTSPLPQSFMTFAPQKMGASVATAYCVGEVIFGTSGYLPTLSELDGLLLDVFGGYGPYHLNSEPTGATLLRVGPTHPFWAGATYLDWSNGNCFSGPGMLQKTGSGSSFTMSKFQPRISLGKRMSDLK